MSAPLGPCTHTDPSLMFVCVLTDSLSAQRAHTHGRRVRHSSSDSSASDCSAESARSSSSSSSNLHSRSPSRSPEVNPDPPSPANTTRPPCNSKEVSTVSVFPVCGFLFWVNSLKGVVALRQLTAGVGRDGGVRNAGWGKVAEVALGISAWVSCQHAQS